jgi:aminoglycoside phosphotransferase (APT) family kinase protein
MRVSLTHHGRAVTVRSIKCVLEPCAHRGRAAIRKRLEKTSPPWRFYMRREIALYEAFAKTKLPVRVPKMLAHDADRGFIVLERVEGKPLASSRHKVPDDRATWDELVDVARAIRAMRATITVKPDAEDVRAMRSRLLEDPTSPWIAEGLVECARRKLIDERVAKKLAKDLKQPIFQHGDLLLRNVLRDDRGLVVVDWECAGPHAEGWDAALLTVFAPPFARDALAEGVDAKSLRACFVFALLREIVFRRGKDDAISARLEEDLANALA